MGTILAIEQDVFDEEAARRAIEHGGMVWATVRDIDLTGARALAEFRGDHVLFQEEPPNLDPDVLDALAALPRDTFEVAVLTIDGESKEDRDYLALANRVHERLLIVDCDFAKVPARWLEGLTCQWLEIEGGRLTLAAAKAMSDLQGNKLSITGRAPAPDVLDALLDADVEEFELDFSGEIRAAVAAVLATCNTSSWLVLSLNKDPRTIRALAPFEGPLDLTRTTFAKRQESAFAALRCSVLLLGGGQLTPGIARAICRSGVRELQVTVGPGEGPGLDTVRCLVPFVSGSGSARRALSFEWGRKGPRGGHDLLASTAATVSDYKGWTVYGRAVEDG